MRLEILWAARGGRNSLLMDQLPEINWRLKIKIVPKLEF